MLVLVLLLALALLGEVGALLKQLLIPRVSQMLLKLGQEPPSMQMQRQRQRRDRCCLRKRGAGQPWEGGYP